MFKDCLPDKQAEASGGALPPGLSAEDQRDGRPDSVRRLKRFEPQERKGDVARCAPVNPLWTRKWKQVSFAADIPRMDRPIRLDCLFFFFFFCFFFFVFQERDDFLIWRRRPHGEANPKLQIRLWLRNIQLE